MAKIQIHEIQNKERFILETLYLPFLIGGCLNSELIAVLRAGLALDHACGCALEEAVTMKPNSSF